MLASAGLWVGFTSARLQRELTPSVLRAWRRSPEGVRTDEDELKLHLVPTLEGRHTAHECMPCTSFAYPPTASIPPGAGNADAMTKTSKPKSEYSIQTVSNALRLLEAFNEDIELGVSELSRRLALHKNNVFRLLATLEERGYIEQCADNERYRLGIRCLELGHTFRRSHSLLDCARPVLEELARGTGESTHIAVLDDFEVVHLDAVTSDQLIGTASRVGRRLAPHCTALGKVLLACGEFGLLEEFDRRVIRHSPLEKFTDATITDRDKFFEHLRTVKVQGLAIDVEECTSGMSCAAAPVFDHTGRLQAALSLSGPTFRLTEELLHREAVERVTAAAARLSQELGYAP